MTLGQPTARVAAVIALVAACGAARPLAAQAYPGIDLGGMIQAGGEAERYLRVLQVAGLVPLTPISIQPFSPSQSEMLRATGPHPWQARFDSTNGVAGARNGAHVLRPQASLVGNSSYPFQNGPGPTWDGRGITATVQAGFAASWKAIHVQLAPLGFAAQNAAFTLAPNGDTGSARFGNPRYPSEIDLPQRFGNGVYSRLDLGSSSLLVDTHHLLAGFTNAPQQWGTAREFPLLLGPNAGGFPTLFAGSSTPWNFWLFQAQGRVIYSELGQSAYTAPFNGQTKRYGSGIVGVIQPRGLPGLEIGGARFIHRPWGDTTTLAEKLAVPFVGLGIAVGQGGENLSEDNQNAVVFARWTVPEAKAEVYGELYKEDHFGVFHSDPISLIETPDDYAAFTVGFQRILGSSSSRIRVFRAEIVNGESSPQQRGARTFTIPLPPYLHNVETEGHTVNGLLLGSPEAYGGSGWRIGMDEFTGRGRRSIAFERSLRFDWLPTISEPSPWTHPDEIYDVRAESLRFDGKREYGITIIPAIDLNRNLVAGHNVFNLLAGIVVRGM